MKVILAVILVLLVGCSGVVEAEREPAQSQAAQVDELEKRVAALEKRVGELEKLRWTAGNATVVAQYKLWERVSSCNLTDCYLRDPLLRAFSNMPARFRADYAMLLVTDGLWTATREGLRWRVEATVGDSDPRVFYVYELDRVVEAGIPSTE
jgi:hypothetical protein